MLFGGRKGDDDTVIAMLASAIRRDISFGVLRADQKLKIEALRQSYGGSNHSMRETLRMLSAEGMVEATNQRGFRVTSATEDDLRDILMMRIQIECLGLRLSLEHADVAWEAQVLAALHALSRSEAQVQSTPDDMTAMQWDEACRALAETLIAPCGSPRLIGVAAKFFNQSRRFRLTLLREGRIDFAARAARQEALKVAILASDAEQAIATWQEDIRADLGA